MMAKAAIHVGVAGWSVPKEQAPHFPSAGSHLERYAAGLSAVEINTSFYRPHRPATYARWAASVPPGFRFAVKMPRTITHEHRLVDADEPLERFLDETAALGEKLGPLLVQLPPSLAFAAVEAQTFFAALRERFTGAVVCEPRHKTWLTPPADKMLAKFEVARVAADPAVVPPAAEPGGWGGLVYYRLHGSPRMYYSSYSMEYLESLAERLRAAKVSAWCIFDNTAEFAATANALAVMKNLS